MAARPPKPPKNKEFTSNDYLWNESYIKNNESETIASTENNNLKDKGNNFCSCTNISIMQLFHEMKQEFPTVPDHVVNQCVIDNCHDRENCIQNLKKELILHPNLAQVYPSHALRGGNPQQSISNNSQNNNNNNKNNNNNIDSSNFNNNINNCSITTQQKPLKPIRPAPSPNINNKCDQKNLIKLRKSLKPPSRSLCKNNKNNNINSNNSDNNIVSNSNSEVGDMQHKTDDSDKNSSINIIAPVLTKPTAAICSSTVASLSSSTTASTTLMNIPTRLRPPPSPPQRPTTLNFRDVQTTTTTGNQGVLSPSLSHHQRSGTGSNILLKPVRTAPLPPTTGVVINSPGQHSSMRTSPLSASPSGFNNNNNNRQILSPQSSLSGSSSSSMTGINRRPIVTNFEPNYTSNSIVQSPISSAESEVSVNISLSPSSNSDNSQSRESITTPGTNSSISGGVTTPSTVTRRISALSIQPEPPYSRNFIVTTSSGSEASSSSSLFNNPRSYTSVNLTLRTPSLQPQSPIDITAGSPGLTYSSTSFDARRGYQKNFHITVTDQGGVFSASRIRPRSCYNVSLQHPEAEFTNFTGETQLRTSSSVQNVLENINSPDSMALRENCEELSCNEACKDVILRQTVRKELLSKALNQNKRKLKQVQEDIKILISPINPEESERLDDDIEQLRRNCQDMLNKIEFAKRSGLVEYSNEGIASVPMYNGNFYTHMHQQQLQQQQTSFGVYGANNGQYGNPHSYPPHYLYHNPNPSYLYQTHNYPFHPQSAALPPPVGPQLLGPSAHLYQFNQQQQDYQQLLGQNMASSPASTSPAGIIGQQTSFIPTNYLHPQQQQHNQHNQRPINNFVPNQIPFSSSLIRNENYQAAATATATAPTEELNADGGPPWTCSMCTFQNHPLLNICECCGNVRIIPPHPGMMQRAPILPQDDINSHNMTPFPYTRFVVDNNNINSNPNLNLTDINYQSNISSHSNMNNSNNNNINHNNNNSNSNNNNNVNNSNNPVQNPTSNIISD